MKAFTVLFFLLPLTGVRAQQRLSTEQITEEISMMVPEEMERTPPLMQRTTSVTLANFYTRDGQTDLGVNLAQLRWGSRDVDLLSQFYKANILNLYDKVQMHDEGISEINGYPFIVFEFSGTIVDEGNAFTASRQKSDYTYIMYRVTAEGVYVFRFTCPQGRRSYWASTVKKMMESVSFVPSKKKK